MTPSRIAIHTDGYLVQGNERQIELIARGLIARGHDVHICARAGSPAWDLFAATGAQLSAARPRGAADLVSALRFYYWLRRVQPDALLFTSWRRLWIAALAARAAGVPNTVMRFGGLHTMSRGWRGAHHRQALLSLVDRIYANSTVIRDHLLGTVPGMRTDRVHIIWNAVPEARTEIPQSRTEIGVAAGVPLVVAVGGLARRKGFDVLIRAFATVATNAHLVICGEGDEREALGALARELGITERVHLPGQRTDVPGILAAADLFVLSSRMEGFSVALLEAMRAGLPIIATDVGGVGDALRDATGRERAGWIVPPDDVERLAAAMNDVIHFLDAPDTVARAAEARRRAQDEYTVERMIDGVERVLLGTGTP